MQKFEGNFQSSAVTINFFIKKHGPWKLYPSHRLPLSKFGCFLFFLNLVKEKRCAVIDISRQHLSFIVVNIKKKNLSKNLYKKTLIVTTGLKTDSKHLNIYFARQKLTKFQILKYFYSIATLLIYVFALILRFATHLWGIDLHSDLVINFRSKFD